MEVAVQMEIDICRMIPVIIEYHLRLGRSRDYDTGLE